MTRGDLVMVDTNILLTATNAQRPGQQAAGKRIHDLNIIALMKEHRIRTILTENPDDFGDVTDVDTMRLEAVGF
jgi:predicted nucleic acid-binding protein